MRTPALILVALLSVAALSGCKKSSKEYFEAQRQYDSLTAREGDDAYVLPEMDAVTQLLNAVPARAVEYERAQALLAKIAAEKSRVAQERAELAAAAPSNEPYPMPTIPSSAGTTGTVPAGAEVDPFDGGVPEPTPTPGMSEALFREQFGSCVSGPEPLKLDGVGDVQAYRANETKDCLRKLQLNGPGKLFFVKGALAGRLSSSSTVTRTILDGGVTTTIIPGAPAPQTLFAIPGAPAPTANTPPPAPGSLPTGATGDGMAPTKAEGDLGARPNP